MTAGSETPTILIVVALKRCLKRSPQGSLSFFKFICRLPTMVSWFRFLDARWSDYDEHQLRRPNGNSAAIEAHEGFNAVKAYPIDDIETGFKDWLKNWKDCPGVMIAVRGKNNSNKGMLDAMHHLKLHLGPYPPRGFHWYISESPY
jgi:hypothetical protein